MRIDFQVNGVSNATAEFIGRVITCSVAAATLGAMLALLLK